MLCCFQICWDFEAYNWQAQIHGFYQRGCSAAHRMSVQIKSGIATNRIQLFLVVDSIQQNDIRVLACILRI